MKKIICCLILIVMLLPITVYADSVEVTKDMFDKGLKNAFDYINDNMSGGNKYTYELKDDKVVVKVAGQSYDVTYNLIGDLSFKTEVEVKNGMTYDEYQEKVEGLEVRIFVFFGYLNAKTNLTIENAVYYYTLMLFDNMGDWNSENSIVIYQSGVRDEVNAPNVFYEDTFANDVTDYVDLSNKEAKPITDKSLADTFELIQRAEVVDENTRKIISEVTVDANTDLNKINEFVEQVENEIEDEFEKQKNNAKHKIQLKVGQSCKFLTIDKLTPKLLNPSDVISWSGDSNRVIKGLKAGEAIVKYTVGKEEMIIYVVVTEKTGNETVVDFSFPLQEGAVDDTPTNTTTNTVTNTVVNNTTSGIVVPTNTAPQLNTPNKVTNAVTHGITTLPKAGYGFSVSKVLTVLYVLLVICVIIFIKKIYDIKVNENK